jgi:hypothetical protein
MMNHFSLVPRVRRQGTFLVFLVCAMLAVLLTLTQTALISDNAIVSDRIANKAVPGAKSADGVATNAKPVDSAASAEKIVSAAVTPAQGLTLPFQGTVSNTQTAFSVTNTGTGGAGFFRVNNTNSGAFALEVDTNGIGPAAVFRSRSGTNNNTGISVIYSGTGTGILSFASNGPAGVFQIGANNSNNALEAFTDGTGFAGEFRGRGSSSKGVFISAAARQPGLEVASGTKNAVVATSQGARALYTEEATEVWFADYGFGRLQNGYAQILIDPLFAETVSLDAPYHVFIQAYGDAELYVSQRTPAGFEVRLRGGDPDVEFSYRLVAKRRGYEQNRLEHAPWADDDPNLYPEKRAEWEAKHQSNTNPNQ